MCIRDSFQTCLEVEEGGGDPGGSDGGSDPAEQGMNDDATNEDDE